MKIKELILYTSNFENQIEFYSKVLEFEIIVCDKVKCSFNIGKSILTFVVRENSNPYHFAFNIPTNKIEEALIWLKKRTPILSFENDEIIEFDSWNANALYFYDPDMNIVEFIARKNLSVVDNNCFSSKSILNISEIALASTNINMVFKKINSINPIEKYSGDFKRFCALGNEEGLFILANPLLKKWFPTNDEIEQSDFKIKGDFNLEFKNGEFIELM